MAHSEVSSTQGPKHEREVSRPVGNIHLAMSAKTNPPTIPHLQHQSSSGSINPVFGQSGTGASPGKPNPPNNNNNNSVGIGMSSMRNKQQQQYTANTYLPKSNRLPNGGPLTNVMTHSVPYERSHTTEILPAHTLGSFSVSRGSGFNGNGTGYSSTRSSHRDRRHHCGGGGHRHPGFTPGSAGGSSNYGNSNRAGGGSLVPTPPPPSLGLIQSMAGDALLFSETNMDWTKLNIFRTRLCDRLTQTHSCHMVNRCLFSHDVNWPRRTPFLPRATALTLRYIPVWCPRLEWPPLVGLCDSSGKITWTSTNERWDARFSHQNCTRGDNCPFVHNLEEFLYHPEVYKTRSCCLANEDNFEEQMSSNCMALCPWYFCPFAHDIYELRDLRGTRYAWHPPPQIVDNQFVARTQGFDELEMQIIDFIRKAQNGSADLYSSPMSPLKNLWHDRMPPVIRPMRKSLIERLKPSHSHLKCQFDELLYVMIIASLLNLLLYPVENFYVPTLLSLQGALLRFQLDLPLQQYEAAWLVQQYDMRKMAESGHRQLPLSPVVDAATPIKAVDNGSMRGGGAANGAAPATGGDKSQLSTMIPSYQKTQQQYPYYSQVSSSVETATPNGGQGHNSTGENGSGCGSNTSYSPFPYPTDNRNPKKDSFPRFQYLLDGGCEEDQSHAGDEMSPVGGGHCLNTPERHQENGQNRFSTTPGDTQEEIDDVKNFLFDSDETPSTARASTAGLSPGIGTPKRSSPGSVNGGGGRSGCRCAADQNEVEEDDLPPGVAVLTHTAADSDASASGSNNNNGITSGKRGIDLLAMSGREVNEELCAILELLEPEELLQMMELISSSSTPSIDVTAAVVAEDAPPSGGESRPADGEGDSKPTGEGEGVPSLPLEAGMSNSSSMNSPIPIVADQAASAISGAI